MALNKVFLQGRVVADPEIRDAGNAKVASFRLAVDRDFKDKDGNRITDFISCVAWRTTAEFVGKWFPKGTMAIVEGKLQVRAYDDKDGNRRQITEVVADNVYFGGAKSDNAGGSGGGNSYGKGKQSPNRIPTPAEDEDDGELPF